MYQKADALESDSENRRMRKAQKRLNLRRT